MLETNRKEANYRDYRCFCVSSRTVCLFALPSFWWISRLFFLKKDKKKQLNGLGRRSHRGTAAVDKFDSKTRRNVLGEHGCSEHDARIRRRHCNYYLTFAHGVHASVAIWAADRVKSSSFEFIWRSSAWWGEASWPKFKGQIRNCRAKRRFAAWKIEEKR